MASFDDVVKGGDAGCRGIIAAGIILAGLEMMDKPATRAVEEFVNAGYDLDAAAILLCESDGTPEEVADEIVRTRPRCCSELQGASLASRFRASESRAAALLVRARKIRVSGRRPHFARLLLHGLAPRASRRSIGPLLARIEAMEKTYRLRCINVFHAGDGNMHPLILFNGNDQDEWHRAGGVRLRDS